MLLGSSFVRTTLIFVGLFACSSILFSQESTRPLELPTFIVEGVEQHNIRSGIKQVPKNTPVLSSEELDSLNSFEKQPPALLPTDKFPEHYLEKSYSYGFVNASYGLFNTPVASAGLRFIADKFDIFATLGGSYSDGDAANSGNSKLFLDVRTSYIADEKFFIFGGSNTRTNLFVNTQNYNFYGYGNNTSDKREIYPSKNYYDRSLTQGKFEVISDGNYENAVFSVGGTANYITTSSGVDSAPHLLSKEIDNFYARGFLDVKNYWKSFLVGGNLFVNFENANNNNQNFFQLDGSLSYFDRKLSVLGNIGFQLGNNSNDSYRTGLLISGNLEYRISSYFTLRGKVFSGLVKTEFEDIITSNPYLSSRFLIDHRYDKLNTNLSLFIHPTEKVLLSLGANIQLSDRILNYVMDTLSQFRIDYVDGSITEIFGEVFLNITNNDRIVSKLSFNIIVVNDAIFNYLTYLPDIKFSATYNRKLLSNLNAFACVQFFGTQNTSTDSRFNKELTSHFLIDIGADWMIKPFNIYLKLNNLTNTNYFVFERYRERGFFI